MSSRKFILAVSAMVASIVALFLGTIDGGTWVAALSLILGLYGGSNVIQKIKGNQ